jgi:hypothetical protein
MSRLKTPDVITSAIRIGIPQIAAKPLTAATLPSPRCTVCGHPALYLQGAHRFCRAHGAADLPRRQLSPEAAP